MQEVSKTEDPVEINQIIRNILSEMFLSDLVSFFIVNKEKNTLYEIGDETTEISMNNPTGLLGVSYLTKKPGLYNHVKSEKYFQESIDSPKNFKIRSQLIYPVVENDNLLAIVRLSRSIKNSLSYTKKDLDLLDSLSPYLIKLVYILLNTKKRGIEYEESEIVDLINEAVEEKQENSNGDSKDILMFLANTVHDIRTPANNLSGFLELLEEHLDNKKLISLLSGAKESAEYINTLVDGILEHLQSRNESGNTETTEVITSKYLSDISNLFTANMTEKGIDYIVSIDPTLPKEIRICDIKLKRVLINLIGNAYKFTPPGKSIKFDVSFDKKMQRIKFSIEDEGIGIPEDKQKEIFEAFKQADEDTKIHYGGTGLGLAISSKYVKDLGGKLELKSQVDKGSIFYFDIPIDIINYEPIYPRFKNINKNILLYTDNPDDPNLYYISKFLHESGMPDNKITISDKIAANTTHLICFEHKLDDEIISLSKEKEIKLLIFEEKLLSISSKDRFKDFVIVSKNSYYYDTLYSFVSSRKKPKVLIIDDNKVNIKLLEFMFEGIYCDPTYETNPKNAIKMMYNALKTGKPYDIVFIDQNMPKIKGSKLLKYYKELESKYPNIKPIYAVSITGDITLTEEEKNLYNSFVEKPFKVTDIKKIFSEYENY